MATQAPTEISIDNDHNLCRIVEGTARRVFFATPEAVGMCLLGINPQAAASHVNWVDFLTSRGLAYGASGRNAYTLMVCPAQKRTIPWKRQSDPVRDLQVTMPAVIFGMVMRDQHLYKSSLYVIKAGWEQKLSLGLTEPVLACFPYGNVYNHGGICWGTTPIQDITQPSEVEGAFFTSGFNGDLYHGYYIGTEQSSLPNLVRHHKGELPAPIESSYTKSIAALITDLGRS